MPVSVASGLAPRWAAQQPHPIAATCQTQPGPRFWGCFAPQRGTSPLSTFTAPACQLRPERPLWRAGLPRAGLRSSPIQSPQHVRPNRVPGLRAASPPNGGQAPSPHSPRQPANCGPSARCGERACPALGCAAAPSNRRNMSDPPGCQLLGRLRPPTGDKPPLHIYRASLPTAARAPVVASGLAPRWAAQQPHPIAATCQTQPGARF